MLKALHMGGAKEHAGVGARLSTIMRLISRREASTRGVLKTLPGPGVLLPRQTLKIFDDTGDIIQQKRTASVG